MQPQQAARTHRYTDILAPVGARHAYRIGQDINLDYGNGSISFLSKNMLASTGFLNVLYKCTIICHKRQYTINFEEVGLGPAKSIIAKCSNKFGSFVDFLKQYHVFCNVTYQRLILFYIY